MARAVLHIGLPKTGTSYVQQSLVQNREALAATGVEVLNVPGRAQHDAAYDLLGRRIGGTDAGAVEGAWPALVDRVARSSHPSVLLSDEVLVHARPRQVRSVATLARTPRAARRRDGARPPPCDHVDVGAEHREGPDDPLVRLRLGRPGPVVRTADVRRRLLAAVRRPTHPPDLGRGRTRRRASASWSCRVRDHRLTCCSSGLPRRPTWIPPASVRRPTRCTAARRRSTAKSFAGSTRSCGPGSPRPSTSRSWRTCSCPRPPGWQTMPGRRSPGSIRNGSRRRASELIDWLRRVAVPRGR